MMPSGKKRRKLRSGSPATGEPEYLVVGLLRRAHGLRGEMLMEVITDFPERLQTNVPVFLGQQHRAAVIESGRALGRGMLVKLRGIETSDAADALRGQQVFVTSEGRAPLQGGQYYHHQLLGSNVVDEHDHPLGRLIEILQTGANDVYVVEQAGGKELLLPAITSVILDVDVEQRLMRVRLPAVLGQDAHG
jgi:16S rRNA processing protein RimM